MAIRIYADFNNCEENGKVRLNTNGSLNDLLQVKKQIHTGTQEAGSNTTKD